ncbi:MAG: thymidine phosphorylase, partial [Gammaproteobacteria bacterium HGW-Gammaproteobacteria-5]
GGGRIDPAARIDFAVGLGEFAQLGDAIESGQPLALVHARDHAAAQRAIAAVQAAFTIGDSAPATRPLVYRSVPPQA